jgi:hypothetical protein
MVFIYNITWPGVLYTTLFRKGTPSFFRIPRNSFSWVGPINVREYVGVTRGGPCRLKIYIYIYNII